MISQNVDSLHEDDWDYLYEGHEHLILKYVGQGKKYMGKVIRLKKIDKKIPHDEIINPSWLERLIPENILRESINNRIFDRHTHLRHYTSRVISINMN